MSEKVLEVKNLVTELSLAGKPTRVVDSLSFHLFRGKTLALVGESGCGKSLTALSLMRLLPSPPALPSQGEVLLHGCDLLKFSEKEMRKIRGAKMSMIFQDPTTALNPVYRIGEQLLESIETHLTLSEEASVQKAINALKEVGIPSPEDRLNDYPHQLSGGMRQRVMIAMALICEPDVLIADEPTTALDVTIQAQVLDLIKNLQAKKGTAVLMITHDMSVVAEVADDVIVMYAAEELEHGSVYDLFDYPAHPYTQALFDARPTLRKTKGVLTSIKGQVPPLGSFPTGCRFHPRCPYVMPICKQGVVPFFKSPFSDNHQAKCWLLHPSKEQMEGQKKS